MTGQSSRSINPYRHPVECLLVLPCHLSEARKEWCSRQGRARQALCQTEDLFFLLGKDGQMKIGWSSVASVLRDLPKYRYL